MMTLSDYFTTRVLAMNPRIRKETTIAAYRIDIVVLQQYFETEYPCRPALPRSILLSDLCADLVSGAAAWQVRRGRSPSTANRLLRHIGAICSWAAQDTTLTEPVPPLGKIRKHKEAKRLPEAWSPEQFASIVSAAAQRPGTVGAVPAGLWWPCLLLTAYWTGVRISALMEAPTAGLDLERGELRFPAETQKHFSDQAFELPANVTELFRKLDPASRGLPTVFADWAFDRTASPWRRLGSHFSQICKAAGLPCGRKDKFHKIRRTFATQITAAQGIAIAQQFLGHSSVSTTQRYIDPRFISRPKATLILPPVPVPEGLRIVG